MLLPLPVQNNIAEITHHEPAGEGSRMINRTDPLIYGERTSRAGERPVTQGT